ncbi:MAG: FG-GAP-like repeat-containing protein [Acidobacteriota bacterium]
MNPGPRLGVVLSAWVACWLVVPSSLATEGGPNGAGYLWADAGSGCPVRDDGLLTNRINFPDGVDLLGPLAIGFDFPFHDRLVDTLWLHRHGLVFFEEPTAPIPATPTATLPTVGDGLAGFIALYWAERRHVAVSGSWEQTTTDTFRLVLSTYIVAGGAGGEDEWLDVELTLHGDGRFQVELLWPMPDIPGTVGIESFDERSGVAPIDRGVLAPDLVTGDTSSLCFFRRPELPPEAWSEAEDIACGRHADVLRDPAESVLFHPSCSSTALEGGERLHRLRLPVATDVTLTIDGPPTIFAALLTEPDETRCRIGGFGGFDAQAVPRGDHWLLIDGWTPEVLAYELDLACTPLAESLACDETIAGSTDGGESRRESYPELAGRWPGPERRFLVDPPDEGFLRAELVTADDLEIVAFLASDDFVTATPLGSSPDELILFDENRPVVLVVDGPAEGDFTLTVSCLPRLSCASAEPLRCGWELVGDTSTGVSQADRHACLDERLDGPELVFDFINPLEQRVELRLAESVPGQRLLLLSDCTEASCRVGDPDLLSCALLPPGLHRVVIDSPRGSEGPFRLVASCESFVSGVDLRLAALDASSLTTDCVELSVAGEARVSVVNAGTVAVGTGLPVVVFEDRAPGGDGVFDDGIDQLLGQTLLATDLEPGELRVLEVSCVGERLFRDSPIQARVDPDGVLGPPADDDHRDSARGCRRPEALERFELSARWHWPGAVDPLPEHRHVDTTPLAGDVNGDGWTEVVVNAGERAAGFGEGFVHVLSGTDGALLTRSTDPATALQASASLALGDLSDSPGLEIVGVAEDEPERLVGLSASGELLWRSDPAVEHVVVRGGAPALADLDCDGRAEVVHGKNAWSGVDGSLFWIPESGGRFGQNAGLSAISVPVDLDGDGTLEVVAGSSAYQLDAASGEGRLLWHRSAIGDGYPAVLDADADGLPEIALTSLGELLLLDGADGGVRWSRSLPREGGGCSPGALNGGPPTVGDVDGDCVPEIGVAGADLYGCFEVDGSLAWVAPISDCTSHRTASTVFDLDGDGAAEVAFVDETGLKLWRGSDGRLLTRFETRSHTWVEMVSVADVDHDGSAELLVPSNGDELVDDDGDGWGDRETAGVWVLGDRDGRFVGTRSIWNQHAYHVDNVTDLGEIPPVGTGRCEAPSWRRHGTFRDQLGGAPLAAADLSLALRSLEIVLDEDCRRQVLVTLRLGNAGSRTTGEVDVSFHDGPADTGPEIHRERVAALSPGAFVDLVFGLPAPRFGELEIGARADPDELVVECREDNNDCSARVANDVELEPGEPPAPVGPALRVRRPAPSSLADPTVLELSWEGELGVPRPAGDRYRLVRTTDRRPPDELVEELVPPLRWTELSEPLPSMRPSVTYYRVLAVDRCGRVEEGR